MSTTTPEITAADLTPKMKELARALLRIDYTRDEAVGLFQKAYLIALLEQEGGNLCRAAKRTGFHRNTWYRLLDPVVIADIKFRCRQMKQNKMAQMPLRGLKYPAPRVKEISKQVAA
jgi:DNA-binding NtrC family response regulator